jgi:hypothetical protein
MKITKEQLKKTHYRFLNQLDRLGIRKKIGWKKYFKLQSITINSFLSGMEVGFFIGRNFEKEQMLQKANDEESWSKKWSEFMVEQTKKPDDERKP